MNLEDVSSLDWDKTGGLLPAIVQDASTGRVLMLGYMNREALRLTLHEGRVTFFSRSKNRLWTKGEISQNYLNVVNVAGDCDNDALLITAIPQGPTCHQGTDSCFDDAIVAEAGEFAFLAKLQRIIAQRIADQPQGSYTARIWSGGPTRMAQKVGEEGVEVALAAVAQSDDHLLGEAADLLFHLTLLLKSRNLSLAEVVRELERRHTGKS
ncbi:MAG TPA: bifunctional phosphoribosyl-AMP cyclohydrolase/phosphoribosyl-ATP diphosphatase HisIE [Steroidobacter sp.]|jgi:phosphoribosyl-ATP pyrophosphohydrolase/phosphoribosyl-AMP cyclohydrolase|nr:bifunctional phosphoribosyl-AMP cyclohydrolase/phosphoribosyl-ATP diphosphatase HisIE [Steroidobacter sp.]